MSLCALAWKGLHFLPTGKFSPCCTYSNFQDSSEDNLDFLQSPEFKKIRLMMLDGIWPDACKTCMNLERNGGYSLRNHANKLLQPKEKKLRKQTRPDGSLNLKEIEYLDIRFSNKCNFKCRTCNPGWSHLWNLDFEGTTKNIEDNPNEIQKLKRKTKLIQLKDNIDYKKILTENIHCLKAIYFAGGEPLIMDEHYWALEKLLESQRKDVYLLYTTNLSQLHYKKYDVTKLWGKFDKICLGISIDGVGDRGEMIRSGFNYNKFLNNMEIIKKFKHRRIHYHFTITVCLMNIFHIPNMIRQLRETLKLPYSLFRLNILQEPLYYNIHCLDPKNKKIVKKLWCELIDSASKEKHTDSFIGECRSVLSFMEEKHTPEHLTDLKKVTTRLDLLRNENFLKVFPELSPLLFSPRPKRSQVECLQT